MKIFRLGIILTAFLEFFFQGHAYGTAGSTTRAMDPQVAGHDVDRYNGASRALPAGEIDVWVFFSDHGDVLPTPGTGECPGMGVSPRASRRIIRRTDFSRHPGSLLPVHQDYIDGLGPYILGIRHRSRYFNAVSVSIPAGGVAPIEALPYVSKVERVKKYERKMPDWSVYEVSPSDRTRSADGSFGRYGASLDQLALTGSVELLEAGYNGSGRKEGNEPVLVCVMDSGFELGHEAFENLRVLEEYDFVKYDSITAMEPEDFPGQSEHGTTVLGAIAGYYEGYLVGPAWGAQYILAKTEIIGQEITIEEDNWIAGIEWADSIGADIVTSSIGYLWDWYTAETLDGQTALCTKAADIAGSRGIVVVNAIGNYGQKGDTSLIAPADGDSVIAVGAVDRYGYIADFSSHGPTADGRIKPDLVAQGLGVVSVARASDEGYATYNGTSFAAPLLAGLCAQILEIHPDWSPVTLRDSLISSASRFGDPDNEYGYGVPRGWIAAGLPADSISRQAKFAAGYPNPFSESISFELYLPQWEMVDIRIYDCRGALVRTIIEEELVKWSDTVRWDGRNDSGEQVSDGVYFVDFRSSTIRRTGKVILMR